ncbi:hypothetical protein QFC24_006876 [Naganishia onofrii]|uniref:Uncharacterized protein n=1 Tax=Naganishia onofrii TaxID=1851511 RepID=A0ACC2WW79_9TREE|nr:hypothetical protein QFC24_006876 [Naganishia onofrii]
MSAQGPADKLESAPHGQIALFRMPEKTLIADQSKIDVENNMEQLVVRVEFESQVQEVTIDLKTATEKMTKDAELPEDVANYYTPEELEKVKADDQVRTVKLRFCFEKYVGVKNRLPGLKSGVGVWLVELDFSTNAAIPRVTYSIDMFRAEVKKVDAQLVIETFRRDSEQGRNKAILKVVKTS